jgi:hypothetical protein
MPLSGSGTTYLAAGWVDPAVLAEFRDFASHIAKLVHRCECLEYERDLLLKRIEDLEKRVELPIFTVT